METVPAVRLHHLSESQKRALALADNRLAENAGWNEALLAQEFKILSVTEGNGKRAGGVGVVTMQAPGGTFDADVAGRLMAFAEREAKRQGYGEIRLYTNAKFVENIALYNSIGYVTSHQELFGNQTVVFMAKALSNATQEQN